ncbi:MAG: hypothetical protein ACI4HO_09145 [Ruminococcus sp.]
MASLTAEQKEQREINREKKRLQDIYQDIDDKRKVLANRLIDVAAYTKVKLDQLKLDISENGLTEQFSQSENQVPYTRKRPAADLFNTMQVNYLKYIKQLDDLLPKSAEKVNVIDGFDAFVDSRDVG